MNATTETPAEGLDTSDAIPVMTTAPDVAEVEAKSDPKPEPERPKKLKIEGKAEVKKAEAKPDAKKDDDEESTGPAVKPSQMTAEMRQVQQSEDRAIKDILDELGPEGSYRIKLYRVEPEEFTDPVSRVRVKTAGHLKDYYTAIDESEIAKRHGGGRYKLTFFRKNGQGGKMTFATQRTMDVVGDPRLDDVPRTMPAAPAPTSISIPPAQEDGKVATAALGMAERMMERITNTPAPTQDVRVYEMMLQQTREQMERQAEEMRELRKELATSRATPQNPVENKLLDKLIDQDSARLTALRAQHDSEIRALKDSQQDEIRRLHDRFDRMMEAQKQSFEREIASVKQLQDIVRSTQSSAADATTKVLEGQIRSLERELATKDKELTDLRNRKDKSPTELIKDFKDLKELISDDDDGDDESTVGKIIAGLPEVLPAIGNMMGKGPQQQQAPAAPPAAPQPPRRQIVQGPDGGKYLLRGNTLVPIKPKQATVPGEPNIPEIPVERVNQVVGLLERAFEGGQDPAVVAQSARAAMAGQEDLFTAVRGAGGVDAYLTKVANLPSSSPLVSQAGKNWVRKFSKELVGD